MLFKNLILSVVALTAVACGSSTAQVADSTPLTAADTIPQRQYTLDEDIGAMLLVGFRGTAVDSTNHIVADLQQRHVGGVILFDYDVASGQRGRNIASAQQVQALCSSLRAISPGLLIGIDQEGGNVCRLSQRYGFAPVASHKTTAMQGTDSVRSAARATATLLRSLGINLNFAPVADVDVNPQCPVIGAMGRSFSADWAVVTTCCGVWVAEHSHAGVACCMKHFPGHGSALGDTHHGVVDVSRTWQPTELLPYRHLSVQVPMVMTAHVINRQLDASGLPASLSPAITALLRDSIGFAGVIVTDDLAMGAISSQYGLRQTIKMAIAAGADMLCLSNNGSHYDPQLATKAVAIIKQLIADGTVSTQRIHQSATRVRALQQAYLVPTAKQ